MSEYSVIRKNGRSPYVKITKQFKELGLSYGEEVEVIVVPADHNTIAAEAPATNELDFPTIAWQIRSSIAPNSKIGAEALIEKIKKNPTVPESRIPDVLKYLVDSKALYFNGSSYWRV